jgi:hypothetical protein
MFQAHVTAQVPAQVLAHVPAQVPAHVPTQVLAHVPAQVPGAGPQLTYEGQEPQWFRRDL